MDKAPLPSRPRIRRNVTIGLVAGWLLILAKCWYLPSLMMRWEVPVDPGRVIIPTLVAAVIITSLVWTHQWSSSDD